MTASCDLCADQSTRYQMTRKCCQVRYISCMPTDRRQRYFQQVMKEQGKAAANELIAAVNVLRRARWENQPKGTK